MVLVSWCALEHLGIKFNPFSDEFLVNGAIVVKDFDRVVNFDNSTVLLAKEETYRSGFILLILWQIVHGASEVI